MDNIPKSELPLICDKCYGSVSKVVKHVNGEECKICTRPFTVYRWQNRQQSANKSNKTIICNTCASIRNCCQSCMLDIEFGIPLEVRDTALKMAGLEMPKYGSQTNNVELKQVQAVKQEAALASGNHPSNQFSKARDLLTKLAKSLQDRRQNSTSETNEAKAKNAPSTITLNTAEINKIVQKYPFHGTLQVDDTNNQIKGYFFFGFPATLPQYVLEDYLKKHGSVKLLTVIHKARCAYALFSKQEAADKFALSVLNNDFNASDLEYPGLLLLDNKYPMRIARCGPLNLSTVSGDMQKKLSQVASKELQNLAAKDVKRKQKKSAKPNVTKSVAKPPGKRSGLEEVIMKKEQQTKKPKFNVDVEL